MPTPLALWVLVSRPAAADCTITGTRPIAALPTLDRGQEFSFLASDDCVTLRFTIRDTPVSRVPKPGPGPSVGPTTYKVVLNEREWNDVVSLSGPTLTWIVSGTTIDGIVTRVATTNDLDQGASLDLSLAGAVLFGESERDWSGSTLAGAGDVDGDGWNDVLIGAPSAGAVGSPPGVVYLATGPLSGTYELADVGTRFVGAAPREWAGTSLAGARDVDGNGYDDVLIGAPGHNEAGRTATGAAYLVLGPATGTVDLASADVAFIGVTAQEMAGDSVASAGDLDGDGWPDLVIGASLRTTSSADYGGVAYVVTDPGSGTYDLSGADATLFGEHDNDIAGNSVAGLGDTNGDGIDDLLVAAYVTDENGYNSGTSYVLYGPVSGTNALSVADVRLVGEVSGDYAGGSTAAAGDVDADGLRDILIGSIYNTAGGDHAGAAYFVRGGTTGTIGLADADAKLVGESEGDEAGISVAGAGDVDADAHDDILVGAWANDEDGDNAGAAYLLRGPVAGSVDLSEADLKLTGGLRDLAGIVAGAGDLDGDGLDDVLVGAPQDAQRGMTAGATYVLYGGAL